MRLKILYLCTPAILFSAVFSLCASAFAQPPTVHHISLSDNAINPVAAGYIEEAIDRAQEARAQCLVIELDTPGGLLTSTHAIVKKILTSEVPVVVYISPSGSRAGSAGVFITYASHVAAMAPSTRIGAAHPIQVGRDRRGEEFWKGLKELLESYREKDDKKGATSRRDVPEKETEPLEDKILNDTVAFIRAMANERGRNVAWAEKSVTESDSITETEALEKKVVEIVARDLEDLLSRLDGHTIKIRGRTITLHTAGAAIERFRMDQREKLLNVLANPNIAYLLLILGFYGLLFEVTHPGFGVPGILGAIFVVLALYSMQMLPTNYAGLGLIVLGILLFAGEAMSPGVGILALGGIIAIILGSLFLFESSDQVMRVSLPLIIAFGAATGGITIFLLRAVIKSHRQKVVSGSEGLLGLEGEAFSDIPSNGEGQVSVLGEIWNAHTVLELKKGDKVKVTGVSGLKLEVEKLVIAGPPEAGEAI